MARRSPSSFLGESSPSHLFHCSSPLPPLISLTSFPQSYAACEHATNAFQMVPKNGTKGPNRPRWVQLVPTSGGPVVPFFGTNRSPNLTIAPSRQTDCRSRGTPAEESPESPMDGWGQAARQRLARPRREPRRRPCWAGCTGALPSWCPPSPQAHQRPEALQGRPLARPMACLA